MSDGDVDGDISGPGSGNASRVAAIISVPRSGMQRALDKLNFRDLKREHFSTVPCCALMALLATGLAQDVSIGLCFFVCVYWGSLCGLAGLGWVFCLQRF